MVLSTRHAYAVSFWSFLMMMTGQPWENAVSSRQNSSLMPTTSLISLDFCWHQLRFLSIWCSIKTFGYVFAVGIIFIWGCFDTALWSPAPSYRWHPSYFSLFWYSNTRSDENRRRFFVCLHGAGPICKQIKDVYWGGQANEKRRPVWTSLKNKSRLQNHPGWTVTWTVKYLWNQPAVYLQSGFHSIECVWKRGERYRFPSHDALW